MKLMGIHINVNCALKGDMQNIISEQGRQGEIMPNNIEKETENTIMNTKENTPDKKELSIKKYLDRIEDHLYDLVLETCELLEWAQKAKLEGTEDYARLIIYYDALNGFYETHSLTDDQIL